MEASLSRCRLVVLREQGLVFLVMLDLGRPAEGLPRKHFVLKEMGVSQELIIMCLIIAVKVKF
jgi:hypothetical protein